jgi:cytochrome c peroxidase
MKLFLIFFQLAWCDPFEESYKMVKFGPKEELGQLLFFDKILSGNKNISCATCHNPMNFTGDALSLPVGEGGEGFGAARTTGTLNKIIRRVPRNSPPLYNLGHSSINFLFLDGRLEKDESYPSGVKTPLEFELPERLDGLLAAQAFFPVINIDEMAGQKGENLVADLVSANNFLEVYRVLTQRLRENQEYVELFKKAFPEYVKGPEDLRFIFVANALASFQIAAFSTLNSPYDKYLEGDQNSISDSAKRGMAIFNGKAKCILCHSGVLQTDNNFHAIATPQIGPGKGHGEKGFEDFGRQGITKDTIDRYKFKTPSLRNVALTGPYGHSGAYTSLRDMVLHHLNPGLMLKNYTLKKAFLPSRVDLDKLDDVAMKDPDTISDLLSANELPRVFLSDNEVDDLLDFLYSLTDPKVFKFSNLIPKRVPSGLPLAD